MYRPASTSSILPAVLVLLPCLLRGQDTPSYAKDVAPILAENCGGCHAAGVKMGGLELNSYENLDKGGNHGKAIVPGRSAGSRLFLMITGKIQPAMPLGGKPLAAGEIEMIRRWVDAGAKGPAPGERSAPSSSPAQRIPEVKPRSPVHQQIYALSYSPDGTLLALAGHKEVTLREAGSGKTVGVLAGHAEVVRAAVFSHDGRMLAAAGGLPARKGEVKLWDVEGRKEVRTIEGHGDCIYAAAFSPDGKWLATSSYDKLIKLWDVRSGQEIRTLKDHIDAVYALTFTPDGKRLVSGSADRGVKVWDPATGERLYTLSEAQDGLNTLALDPAGRRVAAGGLDKTIRVWELGEKGATLANSLIAHEDTILKLAWSPDGKLLASSSSDRTIKVFRADDLAEVRTIGDQPDWVYSIEFAPDGKTLAAGRYDGSLSLYETSNFRDTNESRRAAR